MAQVKVFRIVDPKLKRLEQVGNQLIGVDGIGRIRLQTPLQTGEQYRITASIVSKYTYAAGERIPTYARYYHISTLKHVIPDSLDDPIVFPTLEAKRLTPKELAIAKAYDKKHSIYDDFGVDESTDEEDIAGTGKVLNEVTVSATKIEFYQKGDTLIYNADAFKLGEGATLDALLAKMPGIELRTGGVIYCNGRRLERLLINGRNLFNGRNELMLENIAVYTIKDIAVYDKQGRISELMGRNTGDSNYVMDVRLKREYSMGGTLNAEAGYGTRQRYTGKLFGMWYSDFIALNAYGNINNLSNDKMPGAKDDFTVDDIHHRQGEMTTKAGGMSYNAKHFRGKWELAGSVDATDRNAIDLRQTSRESFYQAGNIFDYVWSDAHRHDFSVSTKHNIFTKLGERAILEIKPEYSYDNERRNSNNVSAQYTRQMAGLTETDVTDSFKESTGAAQNDGDLINRRLNESASFTKVHNASLLLTSNIKVFDIGAQPSMLTLSASGKYCGNSGDAFQRYRYNFGDSAIDPLLSHLYRRNRPDDRKSVSARAGLTTFLDFLRIFIPVNYVFDHEEIKHNSSAYLLSSLSDYDAALWPLDTIPPTGIYQAVADPSQGYESRETITSHRIDAYMNQSYAYYRHPDSRYGFTVRPSAAVDFKHRRYEYFTNGQRQQVSNNAVLPRLGLTLAIEQRQLWKHRIGVDWSLSDSPLYQFVSRPSDGLTHYIGNNDVRTSGRLSFSYGFYLNKPRIRHNVDASFTQRTNSLVMTSTFDRRTGEIYWTPRYANGNIDAKASYRLFSYLDRNRHWTLTSNTQLQLSRTADFSTSFDDAEADLPAQSEQHNVMRYTAEENFKLGWKKGIADLSVFANIKFDRYTDRREDFEPFTSKIYNYGATVLLNLPKSWSFQTDMTVYTRRGFLDERANTTDLVWNARISKSIMKGSLTFMIDGYDILNRLSNITYSVNAQARTVVTTNVLPSYFLMKVVYRFHKGPKVQLQQPTGGSTTTIQL